MANNIPEQKAVHLNNYVITSASKPANMAIGKFWDKK